ncbi:MAG: glycosyltransferase family 2 protein [Verrucomicrobiota bacterium]|jgi:glycosyltransferase involved in cell wall biosynthesis
MGIPAEKKAVACESLVKNQLFEIMQREPLLSVFIPTYNYGRFLGEAVESVLSQNFGDFELFVIDNASTDETRDVMQKYKDTRVEFIVNPRNLGQGYSFDLFLKKARGRYLRALCADDVLIPDVLEEQVKALNRYRTVGLVNCDMIETDERLENRKLTKCYPGFENGQIVAAYTLHIVRNAIGIPSSYMYHREAAQRMKLDSSYNYVGDLKIAIDLLQGRDYLNIDRPGFYYRRHGATSTVVDTNDSAKSEEWFRLVKEYDQFCHLSCWRLLRMPLAARRKLELLGWLARHLFDRKSIQSSFKARKKAWVNANR